MRNLPSGVTILRSIKSTDPSKGIAQEYGYLKYMYGERGIDWHLKKQILTEYREQDGSKTPVDVFQLTLHNGEEVEVWVDISSFFKAN